MCSSDLDPLNFISMFVSKLKSSVPRTLNLIAARGGNSSSITLQSFSPVIRPGLLELIIPERDASIVPRKSRSQRATVIKEGSNIKKGRARMITTKYSTNNGFCDQYRALIFCPLFPLLAYHVAVRVS